MPKLRKTRSPGIYQLEDGRFLARWTVTLAGRRQDREETLPAGASLEEAVSLRAARVTEAKRGIQPPATPPTPPVLGDYARSWLEQRVPAMKRSAALSYAAIIEDHILPKLGHLRVDKITREHVQGWVVWAEQQKRPKSRQEGSELVPYSRDTLLGWWSKLKQLIRDAAADFGLEDATARVRPPKAYGRPRVQEVRTLTAEELAALLDDVPDAWFLEVYTIAVTGMRPGELYALTWPDIDFDRAVITIRRAVYQGEVASTKTGKIRQPAIPPRLLEMLRALRRRQIAEQHPALATGLVFPASEDSRGWHRGASALLNQLVRSSRRAGLPVRVTPQVLRRTVNTLLTSEGVDRLVTREIMGHSSESMTGRYHHAPDAQKLAAVVALEQRVRGA